MPKVVKETTMVTKNLYTARFQLRGHAGSGNPEVTDQLWSGLDLGRALGAKGTRDLSEPVEIPCTVIWCWLHDGTHSSR